MAVSYMICSACGGRTKSSQMFGGVHINSEVCSLTKQDIGFRKIANNLEVQENNLSDVPGELNYVGSDEETVRSIERLILEKQVLKSSIKKRIEEIAQLRRIKHELIEYRLAAGLPIPLGLKE